MNLLRLRFEDCSAFGRLVLHYLEANPQTNMSQLAKQVGLGAGPALNEAVQTKKMQEELLA